VFASTTNGSAPRRPLHPPLVHVPVGGVVIAAMCDLVSLIGGASHGWATTWFKGGSYALLAATAMLLVAALAGFVDRARHTDPGGPDRAAINRHAAAMSLMGIVCIVDVVLRSGHYDSAPHTPAVVLVLTFVALALAALGGELGGRLVYRAGIGVQPPAAATQSGDTPAVAADPRNQATRPGPMTDRRAERAKTPPWRARLATTLAAWMAAFGVVMTLLSLLGDELGSLPLAIRALILSGAVVTIMTTVVMPTLEAVVRRRLAGPTPERSPALGPRTSRGSTPSPS
jgi:uncharacterized membrane protein